MSEPALIPYMLRIASRQADLEANFRQQMALLEKIGQLTWPKGHIGRDGRRLPNPMPRFIACVSFDPETFCWNWVGSMQRNGYGAFPLGGVRHLAHRWIYQTIYGPVRRPLVVDHTCHNKRCVNITHLEAITQSENVRRSLGRPKEIPAFLPRLIQGGKS